MDMAIASNGIPPQVIYAVKTDDCPKPDCGDVVAHSFSDENLRASASNPRIVLILHRGSALPPTGFTHVRTHIELGVLFSHRTHGPRSVSSDELLQRLSENLMTTNNRGLNVLRHGGELNEATLRKAVEDTTGRSLSLGGSVSLPNYRALALATVERRGAVAIGLRGMAAAHSDLRLVKLDGYDPADPADHACYPLRCSVQVYVRERVDGMSTARAMSYLARIQRRISLDHELILGIGESWRHRAAA